MSAKDTFHESVKRALQKEQWVITADPLKFKFGNVNFQVDLGAERLVAAERGGEKIAVEIKSFLNSSAITDFYAALGQFLSYRLALASVELEFRLSRSKSAIALRLANSSQERQWSLGASYQAHP
ncbi:element excision factor XisH family protein [Microcoleus sp. S13_C5]|uniref:element excision factor XisH family protein n=1 Tax=Microcoleus sp. S13_C5 TaxID=3055411 RepID=UPI002FD20192